MEISNLPEREFRIMIVKMIQDLGKIMEANIHKMKEMFSKDLEELKHKHLEELKNKQTEMNNTITEVKNTLEGINENSLRDLWENNKCTNIHIIGIPEGEEREKGPKKIFEETVVENFPNMGNEIATQVQEAQRVPGKINPRRNMPRHIVIELTKIKDKEKLLKATKEKRQKTYKGTPVRLTADFSAETRQARREWNDIFKVMKGKNLQLRLLYPARISFSFDREIKSFTDKQKLREFSTTKPALQQMLKELL